VKECKDISYIEIRHKNEELENFNPF